MTFIFAIKIDIKGRKYIFSLSDSKAIKSTFYKNFSIENKQKIKFSNKNLVFLMTGLVRNIEAISILPNVKTTNSFLFQFNIFKQFQKENQKWKLIYFGFNQNNKLDLNMIYNNGYSFEYFNANQFIAGSGYTKLVLLKKIPSKFEDNSKKILSYNSFFECFLDIFILANLAYKNEGESVNNIFQFSFMSNEGVSFLFDPRVGIEKKDIANYLNLNFPNLKKISKQILDNFYIFLIKSTIYYINKSINLIMRKKIFEVCNLMLKYFIKKDINNFFELYIQLNIDDINEIKEDEFILLFDKVVN